MIVTGSAMAYHVHMENVTRFLVVLKGTEWKIGSKRRTAHQVDLFITGVSWGDGSSVKSVTHSKDRAKGFGFSEAMAQAIAAQYNRPGGCFVSVVAQ